MGVDTMSDLNEVLIRESLKNISFGNRVLYMERTSSTMDQARKLAVEGCEEGTLVIAEEQSFGRGRFNRQWISPPGLNLYLTVILRPNIGWLPQLSMMAATSIVYAIKRISGFPLSPTVKWPNDVRIGGKKVAGILIENEIDGDSVEFCLIGIGINVNFDPTSHDSIVDIATSIRNEIGHDVSRLETMRVLIEQMETSYERIKKGISIVSEWEDLIDTIGKRVTVLALSEKFQGHALGVNESGSLVVKMDNGTVTAFSGGEVTIQVD